MQGEKILINYTQEIQLRLNLTELPPGLIWQLHLGSSHSGSPRLGSLPPLIDCAPEK